MSVEHRVLSVERTRIGNRDDWWAVAMVEGDGTRVRHVFPPDALHWRAAEYGIDPQDAHTLLDIILHERHVSGWDHHHRSPDFLYNTDPDTARTALHRRISDVKTRARVVDPDGHLDQIRAAHTHVPEHHAQRQAFVAHLRQHGTKIPKEPDSG